MLHVSQVSKWALNSAPLLQNNRIIIIYQYHVRGITEVTGISYVIRGMLGGRRVVPIL